MSDRDAAPVILLAFANEQDDRLRYLRKLPDEARRLRQALEGTEAKGLCEVVTRTNATLADVRDVFRRYEGRVAVFHFGGHADSYRLLFEEAGGQTAEVDSAGLAAFLAQQPGLHLVFLNACSTAGQVAALLADGCRWSLPRRATSSTRWPPILPTSSTRAWGFPRTA